MTRRAGVAVGIVAAALIVIAVAAVGAGLPSPSTAPSPSLFAAAGPSPSAAGGPSPSISFAASLAPSSVASAPGPTSPPVAPTARPTPRPALPDFAHVFVIVMENKGYGSIIGNPDAPYINGLASRYALATDYTAVAHPSEPNYLALWSGSTQGVTNDGVYDFGRGTTLGDQVLASGRSWHVAAQNVPLGCYGGSTASGGEDGPGTYARKHEPAISWTSVSGNPARCARITDFSHFDPIAGNLWFIVPNLCNDMHDCSVATGDAFLRRFLPRILSSAAFADGVVFLTWDEGTTSVGGGGRVATLVISPFARRGDRSSVAHDHDSLLRTIEDAWRLPCLADACGANDLRELFG